MQIFSTNKIDSYQEKYSYPDFGRYRRGTSQGEREPNVEGEKRQKTNGYHHSSQDERTGPSQVFLYQPAEIASLVADRAVARHSFRHRSDREHIDHAHDQQDDHPWQWTYASQCNGQSKDRCSNRFSD